MTPFDEDVLEIAMSQVQAWESLNDPYYCGQLSMEGLYKLLIRAGYPKEVAQKAANQRGWDRLTAGEII